MKRLLLARQRCTLVLALSRFTDVNGSLGMSLVELLIAILLFAIFSGIFVIVTEYTTSLSLSDQPSKVGAECMGAGEDRACIELYFDSLVQSLESSAFPAGSGSEFYAAARGLDGKSQCAGTPEALFPDLLASERPDLTWPVDYTICIYAYESPLIQENLDATPQRPGLYLLQAQPSEALRLVATRKPVQRLFCRPRYLCG